MISLYKLQYDKEVDWPTIGYKNGWELVLWESRGIRVQKSWIFPYAVGYLDNSYYYASVQSAVNDAFSYYTSNEKSEFYDYLEEGNFRKVESFLRRCFNDYYEMSEDSVPQIDVCGSSLFEKDESSLDRLPYQYCYFTSPWGYRVFIASTQPETWSVKKRVGAPDQKEMKRLWLYWAVGLTILLLFVVVPLWVSEVRHRKLTKESSYAKLKRLCNPANFMSEKTYDKEKVDKANAIYRRLMETKSDDEVAIKEISQQVEEDLHVSLIDSQMLAELKEKVNPQNFMSPYNPEKLALSNELYAILNKDALTFSEMKDVEERSKLL